jgi:uncharacterized membrane protein
MSMQHVGRGEMTRRTRAEAMSGRSSQRRLEGSEAEAARWRKRSGAGGGTTLAEGLGWFSIALGLAQVAAPRQVARLIGVREDQNTQNALRACGVREITSGVGILSSSRPTGWMWARVGGDVMDLALLAREARDPEVNRQRVTAAALAVAGVTVLDVMASQGLTGESERWPQAQLSERTRPHGEPQLADGSIRIKKAVTIRRTPEELYRYWRKLENLPTIMGHLESVEARDAGTSHWKAKVPGPLSIEWDAEIIKDEPHTIIAWRSLPGADVQNAGSVRFKQAPAGRGTELVVDIYYRPPGGAAGRALARLFGTVPEVELLNDLRSFKQLMELGERIHSDASIHRGMHPAQPSREAARLVSREPSPAQSTSIRSGGVA